MNRKLQGSLIAGLMFFIISHPIVYKLVDSLVGPLLGSTASPDGSPTTLGLIVHSAVFAVAVYYQMGA